MSGARSYRDALGAALREAMDADDRVVVLGQDVGAAGGAYGVTAGLLEAFGPQRVRDAPSSDAALVGVGIGAALAGLRPVVELTTAAYLPLAFDQLVHHAAALGALSGGRMATPLVLRMPQSTGARLGPVHAANVEALLHHVPGLAVVAPSTPADAHGLLAAAIAAGGPVVVLEHTALYDVRDDGGGEIAALGRAAVRRAGTDVTLIAASRMARVAQDAATTLARDHGIEATVVDLRSLRPLDLETLHTAARGTGRVVVAEEGWPHGGIGATLAALLDVPVARVTGADVAVPYARTLERAALPDAADVVAAALAHAGARRRRRGDASDHTMSIEVDVEDLVAGRRAGRGASVGGLAAEACAALLAPFGAAAVVTSDGAVTLVGARDGAPAPPAATLTLAPIAARPTAREGAVTIRHLTTLTLHLAAGLASSEEAAELLAQVRARLERPAV